MGKIDMSDNGQLQISKPSLQELVKGAVLILLEENPKVDPSITIAQGQQVIYRGLEASDIEIEPPWQIKKLAAPFNKSWYMRDSNWSPDFK